MSEEMIARTELKALLKSWIELIKRCESIEKAINLPPASAIFNTKAKEIFTFDCIISQG